MKSLAWSLLLAFVGSSAMAAERVYTPEGWYQIEDEGASSDADTDSLAVIIVHEGDHVTLLQQEIPPQQQQQQPQPPPPAPPQTQPPPQQPQQGDSLQAEIERFREVDCEYVRGRYLQRVMELHGLDVGLIAPKDLAALTYTQPPVSAGNLCFGQIGCLPAPSLAPLYGLPPIPPGALSYDLELKELFRKLVQCVQQDRGMQPSRQDAQQQGMQSQQPPQQPQQQQQQQQQQAQPQSMPNTL